MGTGIWGGTLEAPARRELLAEVSLPRAKGSSPYQNAFHVENPAPRKGRLTARPSGKFWIPIPIAKFLSHKKKKEKNI